MMNLYELTQGYLNVLNMSDDVDMDDQYIKDTLEMLDTEIHDKADNYVRLIKTLEGECLMLNTLIDDTQKKYDKKAKLINYLKSNLMFMMDALDEREIKTKFANVKIVKNGGIAPMEIDEQNVPIDYMKQIFEIDKQKIRKDIEDGKQLSFATIKERGEHLAIK